jgi:hypothetical protein
MEKTIMKQGMTIVALLILASAAAEADPLAIPNTFSPGASISSSQMNGNFTALVNAINTLQTKVNDQAVTIASQAALISGLQSLNPSSRSCNFVNAGVEVTLGNLKASIPTSDPRHIQLATVSGTISLCGTSRYTVASGVSGSVITPLSPRSISPTATAIMSTYYLYPGESEEWILKTTTNSDVWRIYALYGVGFTNNFILIEKIY